MKTLRLAFSSLLFISAMALGGLAEVTHVNAEQKRVIASAPYVPTAQVLPLSS